MKSFLSRLWVFAVCCGMVWGLWSLIADTRQLRVLQQERERLEGVLGHIDWEVSSRLQVVNLRDHGPRELLWHVAGPAGQTWQMTNETAVGSSGSSSVGNLQTPLNMLVRVGLVERDGRWLLFAMHASGSTSIGLSNSVGNFLQQRWQSLEVEMAARNQPADYAVDEIITLISVKVPKELLATAQAELDDYVYSNLATKPLFQLEMGKPEAFAQRVKVTQGTGE